MEGVYDIPDEKEKIGNNTQIVVKMNQVQQRLDEHLSSQITYRGTSDVPVKNAITRSLFHPLSQKS